MIFQTGMTELAGLCGTKHMSDEEYFNMVGVNEADKKAIKQVCVLKGETKALLVKFCNLCLIFVISESVVKS
jgi:hypothetical protein